MRIVTWNLGYWLFREHHEDAWRYLEDVLRPDVALLQEVRPPTDLDRRRLVFREVHGGWGTAVYSRGLELKGVPFESAYPNRAAVASATLPDGRLLHFASIHAPIVEGYVFPHLSNILDEIEDATPDTGSIVGGDLNSARFCEEVWPGYGHGPFFERVDAGRFVDCCQRINGREIQTYFTKRSKLALQDDHIFVTRDLEAGLRKCEVVENEVTRRVSDHIPLLIELRS